MKRYQEISVIFVGMIGFSILLCAGTVEGTVEGKDCTNMVVYLKNEPGGAPAPSEPAVIDQKGKEFVPHVLPVMVGQKVILKNNDPFYHNVHGYRGKKTVFNHSMPFTGMTIEEVMTEPGEIVLLCDAHPEMSAYILVLENPYFAMPDSEGNYRIEDVPPGEYTLVMYRPEKKPIEKSLTVSEDESLVSGF